MAQCILCGERLAPAQLLIGNGQCQACCDYPPNFDRAISYGEYASGLRDLIHLLKYDAVLPAARPLGKLLAQAIEQLRLRDVDALVVPVPLHSARRRERRFNQADLIARAALQHLPPQFELDRVALLRQRPTRSQVGLDREARIRNMHGAFRVTAPQRISGRTIIVVDDVMTTGTTVSECARVMKRAGAEKVFAATVARTLKHPDAASFGKVTEGEKIEAQLASV